MTFNRISRSNSLNTTDATPTAFPVISLVDNSAYNIEVSVIAIRTGGSGGSTDDSAMFVIRGGFKRSGAATTQMGATYKEGNKDNMALDCNFNISHPVIEVEVTGDTNNNYTWNSSIKIVEIG